MTGAAAPAAAGSVPSTFMEQSIVPTGAGQPDLSRSQLRVLVRGATRACGVCGRRRGLFRRYVIMIEDCPRCGLHFERTDGHYIGAVGINTIVSFGLLVVLLSAFFIATYPDIPAGPWVFGAAAIYGLVPVGFYPISKTLWTAIDLLMRPLEPDEVRPPSTWTDADRGRGVSAER